MNLDEIKKILLEENLIQLCKVKPSEPAYIVYRPNPAFLQSNETKRHGIFNWIDAINFIMDKYPISKNFLDQFILNIKINNSIMEVVYCINNNLIEVPKCPICNKPRKFNFKHYKHRFNCYEDTCNEKECIIHLNRSFLDKDLINYLNNTSNLKANSNIVKKIFQAEGILCNTSQIRYDGNYQLRLGLQSWEDVETYIKSKYKNIIFDEWFKEFDHDQNKIITAIKFNIETQLKCPYCGDNRAFKHVETKSLENCYFPTCGKHECVLKEKEKTSLKNWGTSIPMHNPTVANKIKQTNLKKYGVEFYTQTKECKEKTKETNLKRYGVESYTQTEEYLKKAKETNLEKRGYEWPMQDPKVRELSINTCLEKYGVANIN